jgi:hypothetical protein
VGIYTHQGTQPRYHETLPCSLTLYLTFPKNKHLFDIYITQTLMATPIPTSLGTPNTLSQLFFEVHFLDISWDVGTYSWWEYFFWNGMVQEITMEYLYFIFEASMQELHYILNYWCFWTLFVKLLPLPQPPLRAHTDARTNPSAQRATQLRSVLARVYAVARQNQITTTVP